MKQKRQMMTIKEAAEYLGYKEQYLYQLCAKKLIPHYRMNGTKTGKIKFEKSELDEYIKKCKVVGLRK